MIKIIINTTVCCIAVFVLALSQSACVKEKADKVTPAAANKFDINRIWNCHDSSNPYPSQINQNLEGTWVWISNSCYWNAGEATSADKHVVVTFNDGGLYEVFENSKIESKGSWKLSQAGNNTWSIITSAPSAYLNGYVLLCSDEVVFYSSYLDGCDYYFHKSE